MEEKINVQETLKKLKEEHVENFVKNKLECAELSDMQKGMITEWIKETFDLGYALGERYSIAETNPEALGKAIGVFTKSLENSEADISDEHLKKVIHNHRGIVRWLAMAISSYESLTDELVNKHIPLKTNFYECMGLGLTR